MNDTKLLQALVALSDANGIVSTSPPPGICIYRRDTPSALEAYLYEPVLCAVLQGEKMMRFGDQEVHVGAGDALVVSHHLPVISQITQAQTDAPYLAIVLSINLMMIRELYAQIDTLPDPGDVDCAIACASSKRDWLEPLHRYLCLAKEPRALTVLGPSLLREIHYRLLMSETGKILHNLFLTDSHSSQIARAIHIIREQLAAPLRVPELAEQVGMSNSAFHRYFKVVTGTTPLQFQKDLRLIASTSLLESGAHTVSSTAFEVGYESPTHFSRDYKRKFGFSPSVVRS